MRVIICEDTLDMNPLVDAMYSAERERWCVTTWCTTCGHRDFAEAVVNTESPPSLTIASLLTELDFDELQSAPNWKDCIQSIFQRLRGPGKPPMLSSAERQRVLQAWATRLVKSSNVETRFTDFILFYLVRNEPTGSAALALWVEHALNVLSQTQDTSLAETLIYFARRHDCFRAPILNAVLELMNPNQKLKTALEKLALPEGR